MQNGLLGLAVALALTVAGLGCATLGKGRDEEEIHAAVARVKEALEKKDIDALMATFSDNYKDPRVGGKAEARLLLQQGLLSGYADNGKVNMDGIKVTLSDDKTKATVYPLDLSSSMGAISVEIIFAKEKTGWLVSGVNPNGV